MLPLTYLCRYVSKQLTVKYFSSYFQCLTNAMPILCSARERAILRIHSHHPAIKTSFPMIRVTRRKTDIRRSAARSIAGLV